MGLTPQRKYGSHDRRGNSVASKCGNQRNVQLLFHCRKCNSHQKLCIYLGICTGKAPEPPAETSEPEKEKPAGLNPAALILLLALLGGGGVFAYLKLVKNKAKTKGNDSLDDYDYGEEDSEEWETEDEESDESDADRGSTEEDDEDSVK